ncbi:MAG: MBL fold metallo-hydrolase [Microgenomates group bacterium]
MVFRKNIIYFLILLNLTVWLAVFSVDSSLKIIACDVGQGDAILIQKNTTQILIDGGPNQSVLNCLGRHMPFWDKQIEMVILTHPQEDHYGGLIDVFKSYKIVNFGENNTNSSNRGYEVLKNLVGGSGATTISLTDGTVIKAGMMQLDILWPLVNIASNKNSQFSSNVNDDGVVILLKHAQFKALFTADVENVVSNTLSGRIEIQNIDYIKVNHHGSKNGMSQNLLNVANPEIAVISVAAKNRYGHPHAEIIKMLTEKGVKILRTDEVGDVVMTK